MIPTNIQLGNADRQVAVAVQDALIESQNPEEITIDGQSLQQYLARTEQVEELTEKFDTPMYQGGIREPFLDYTFAKQPTARNLIFGTLSKAINVVESSGQITENPDLAGNLENILEYEGFQGLESLEEIERVREVVADQESTYETIDDEFSGFVFLPSQRRSREEQYASQTGRIRQAATGAIPAVERLSNEFRPVYLASHGFNNY